MLFHLSNESGCSQMCCSQVECRYSDECNSTFKRCVFLAPLYEYDKIDGDKRKAFFRLRFPNFAIAPYAKLSSSHKFQSL